MTHMKTEPPSTQERKPPTPCEPPRGGSPTLPNLANLPADALVGELPGGFAGAHVVADGQPHRGGDGRGVECAEPPPSRPDARPKPISARPKPRPHGRSSRASAHASSSTGGGPRRRN